MAITLEQAKQLQTGDRINVPIMRGLMRTPKIVTAKITSVKTWKTRPNEVRIRAKFGLFTHYELNQDQLDQISLPKEIA